jgi:small subunit ribosomal protein S14
MFSLFRPTAVASALRTPVFTSLLTRTPTAVPSLMTSGQTLVNGQQVRHRFHHLRNRARIKRDILRHESVSEFELQRMVYKALHRDQRLDMSLRLKAMMTLHSMNGYTRKSALKPRCVETGRGNGLMRGGWKISRIVFRESAINGLLPGIRLAKW